MPTYVYKCDHCGYEFERVQKMTDDPVTECPKCSSDEGVHKVIQAAGGFRIWGRGVHKPTSRIG